MSYNVVKIPPLPPEISSLISLAIDSQDSEAIFAEMRQSLDDLRNICATYSRRAEHPKIVVSETTARIKELNCADDFNPRTRTARVSPLRPEIRFIKQKFERLSNKLGQRWREAAAQCSTEAGIFICTLKEFLEKEIPVKVNLTKFYEHLERKSRPADFEIINRKRDALRAKLDATESWSKYRKVNEATLKRELAKSAEQIKDGAMYAPETGFDDALFCYYQGRDGAATLIDTVMGMRGFGKNIRKRNGMYTSMFALRPTRANFEAFHENLAAAMALCCDPGCDDKKKDVVVRSAFTRLVFDALFEIDKSIERKSGRMNAKARKVVMMTPKELGVADGFFAEEDNDKPIAEIAKNDPELREMADMIASLAFLMYPIEIACIVQKVVDMIGARVNRQKKTKDVMQLDDLMSCLIPVVALNPPPNAVGINDFLQMYSNDRILPARLSQASSLFSAAVCYVKDLGDPTLEAPSNL